MTIYDKKYPVSTKAMLSQSKTNKNTRDLFGNIDPKSVFTKVAPTDLFTDIRIGSSSKEVVYLELSGIVYKVQGSGNGISTSFVKVKAVSNVTEYLESAAILGVFGITSVANIRSFPNPSELGLDINEFESLESYKDEAELIMKGTSKFEPVPEDFIHKNIKTYYKALEKFEGLSSNGSKPNTADTVLIYNSTKEKLLSALGKLDNTIFTATDGTLTIDGIEFKQISLKKGEDEARLGRITTYIKTLIGEKQTSENDELLTEAFKIFDLASKGFKYFQKMYTKITTFISNISKYFGAKKMEKELNSLLSKALTESTLTEKQDTIKTISSNIKKLNKEDVYGVDIREAKLKKSNIQTEINLLLANDISFNYLLKLFATTKKMGAKEFIINMDNYMRKGNTNLPVVMLYGNGTSTVITSKELDDLLFKSIKPIYLKAHTVNNNAYYVISLYTIDQITEGTDPIYTHIQLTNAGGNDLRYKIEGNKKVRLSKILLS